MGKFKTYLRHSQRVPQFYTTCYINSEFSGSPVGCIFGCYAIMWNSPNATVIALTPLWRPLLYPIRARALHWVSFHDMPFPQLEQDVGRRRGWRRWDFISVYIGGGSHKKGESLLVSYIEQVNHDGRLLACPGISLLDLEKEMAWFPLYSCTPTAISPSIKFPKQKIAVHFTSSNNISNIPRGPWS